MRTGSDSRVPRASAAGSRVRERAGLRAGSARLVPSLATQARHGPTLVGTLVLARWSLLYTVEVFYQVWLQARFLEAIPEGVRAAFPAPPAPRVVLVLRVAAVSVRGLALRAPRSARRCAADHLLEAAHAREHVRESILLGCFAVAGSVLVWLGWRPI